MNTALKRAVIIEALILALWLVMMVLFQTVATSQDVFIVSIVFGIVAFAASVASLLLVSAQQARARALADTQLLISFVPGTYFGVALIVNSLACIMPIWWMAPRISIVVNLALMVIAAVVLISMNSYTRRVDADTEAVAAAVGYYSACAQRASELLALSTDQELTRELRALKEAIDFSSTASTDTSAAIEQDVLQELDALEDAMHTGEKTVVQIQHVQAACALWHKRNTCI